MGNSKSKTKQIYNQNSKSPIKSVKEFIERINQIREKYDSSVEEYFLFRGQENEEWSVKTSAYRRFENTLGKNDFSEEDEINYNIKLIEDYEHKDFNSNNLSQIIKTDFGALAQLQHDGAATSLIDFTTNSLVALWFACQKEHNRNGKVFILEKKDSSQFEEIKGLTQLKAYKMDDFRELGEYDLSGLLNDKKWVCWKPANINNRILAQQSYFIMGRRELPAMKEVTIARKSKRSILEELLVLHGIKETTLFPDAMGFAKANSVTSSYNAESQKDQNERTIRRYDKKIKAEPDNIISYFYRGLAKYSLGKYKSFIDDFNKVIKYYPHSTTAYYNRGFAKEKSGDVEGAILDYKQAFELDPQNADAYNNCGHLKITIKDYEGAVKDANRAIELDPQNSIFYSTRGEAYEKLYKKTKEAEDLEKAIADYKKSIELSDSGDLDEFQLKARKTSQNGLKRLENNPPKDV